MIMENLAEVCFKWNLTPLTYTTIYVLNETCRHMRTYRYAHVYEI